MSNETSWLQATGMANAAVAGLAAGIGTRKEQERQFNYNMEMAKWQNDVNVANWQMQNEYNTPANQMKRLKEAGINPNLAYSNGSVSNTSSPVSAAGQPHSVTPVDQIRLAEMSSGLMDQALKAAQIEKTAQETDNLAVYQRNSILDGEMKELQIIAQNYSNAKSKEEVAIWGDLYQSKLKAMDAKGLLDMSGAFLNDSKRFYTDAQKDYLKEVQTPYTRSSTARNISEIALNDYRKNLMTAQASEALSRIGVNNAMADRIVLEAWNLIQDHQIKGEVLTAKQFENELNEIFKRTGVDVRNPRLNPFKNQAIINAFKDYYGSDFFDSWYDNNSSR